MILMVEVTLLPETGASRNEPPFAEILFASSTILSGVSVAQSTTTLPSVTPATTPSTESN